MLLRRERLSRVCQELESEAGLGKMEGSGRWKAWEDGRRKEIGVEVCVEMAKDRDMALLSWFL